MVKRHSYPDTWSIGTLEDICIPNGVVRGPFGGALKKEIFVPFGYKVYEQRNAIYQSVNIGSYYVNESKYREMSRFAVKSGDYIISCSGTIGRIYQIPLTFPKGIINQALLKLTINTEKINPTYFYKYFQWDKFQQKIIDDTQGGAMKNLVGMDIFKKAPIVLPEMKEQTAIAEALSDIDGLISSLQKLIEKKKAIKQGAMQELLTGKKRLPGFSEEWAYRRVGEICSITKGQIITEKTAIHGNVPVIAGGKTPAFYHNVANRESDVITISASGANAGYIAFHDYPIFASDCSTIESSDQYDVKFIYYALLYHQQELIGMQTGGAQPHIHPKEIGVLLVPRINQEEQRAIANVLSDMDSEIEQLEKKLAKCQQIKQGMMQELLTGRIRLV